MQAKIEVTLLSPDADGNWTALIKPLRKLQIGEVVRFEAGLEAELLTVRDGQGVLCFNLEGDEQELGKCGEVSLRFYDTTQNTREKKTVESKSVLLWYTLMI